MRKYAELYKSTLRINRTPRKIRKKTATRRDTFPGTLGTGVRTSAPDPGPKTTARFYSGYRRYTFEQEKPNQSSGVGNFVAIMKGGKLAIFHALSIYLSTLMI